MRYTGIIFDFNGVLLWDTHLHEQVWSDFAAKLRGTPLTAAEARDYMHGCPNQDIISYILGRPASPEEIRTLTQEKEVIYRNICLTWDGFHLSPGAIDLLDFLVARQIPHTIATASEISNVRFFIERLELARWFDVERIVLDDGTFPGKPAPDIYLRAAANIGVPPAQCIAVEDSVAGIMAAHRAGIGRIYALGPTGKHAELRQISGVAAVITQLTELHHDPATGWPL
jgi:beta-phosphoglucomutase-like phosphatase (HAD superfamily)